IEPDMLETVSCAVNRRTKSGVLLGETERISPLEALRAVTINAAYQYGEEDRKGSIKPGKNADFVILSGNPLTVPPAEIGEINLLETIKNGVSVYRRA
ncbi:MAG: amidohydrolase family protein, partial [Oscillospiraceae bacterium]